MIKILFIAANPTDIVWLRVGEESRAIDRALRSAKYRDLFQIETHLAVRVGDISELLLRHQPNIVHFSGHGTEKSEIILEDDAGMGQAVSTTALSNLFSVLSDNIRCVVLNACYSERQAQAIAKHIDCVVGMSDAIGDLAGIRFASSFYLALGYGRDVQTAFDLGTVEIALEGLEEHDMPRLLANKARPSTIFFTKSSDSEISRQTDETVLTASAGQQNDEHEVMAHEVIPHEVMPHEVMPIVTQINRGRIALFIGADLTESMSGLPSRQDLADMLAQQEGIAPGQRLEVVAQQVMSHGNRYRFTDFLLRTLDPVNARPGPFYQKLALLIKAIRPELVITTAYHRLLEIALRTVGDVPTHIVPQDIALQFADPERLTVFQLYGGIQQLETLIVTEQDHNALLRGRVKPEMVDEVRRIFRRNTILFMGYDLSDSTVGALFDEVAGGRFQIPSYALWSGLTEPAMESFRSNRGLSIWDTDPVKFLQLVLDKLEV